MTTDTQTAQAFAESWNHLPKGSVEGNRAHTLITSSFLRHPHLLVCIVALFVASACVWYSTLVPLQVDGDEIVLIESEKAKATPGYPGAEIVTAMGYDTYLYPKIIYALSQVLSIPEYKRILLFVLVYGTVLSAFYALRMLEFSPGISLATSLVALMPRAAPVGETFGILTLTETMGRSFVVPIFWLLAAWYIRRTKHGKGSAIVFFVMGILTAVHPLTMIMFFTLTISVHGILAWKWTSMHESMRDILRSVVAFCIGATPVLFEIAMRATSIASTHVPVNTRDYIASLFFRIPWEYPPESIIWLRHSFIVSALFFACGTYVWYRIRKGMIERETMQYRVVVWATWAFGIAFMLHLAVPVLQLYAIRVFDAPLVLWQFGRMYKLTYLSLILVFAVTLNDVYRRYGIRWAAALMFAGIASSTFFSNGHNSL